MADSRPRPPTDACCCWTPPHNFSDLGLSRQTDQGDSDGRRSQQPTKKLAVACFQGTRCHMTRVRAKELAVIAITRVTRLRWWKSLIGFSHSYLILPGSRSTGSGSYRRIPSAPDGLTKFASAGAALLDFHRQCRHFDPNQRSVVYFLQGFGHRAGGAVRRHVAYLKRNHEMSFGGLRRRKPEKCTRLPL